MAAAIPTVSALLPFGERRAHACIITFCPCPVCATASLWSHSGSHASGRSAVCPRCRPVARDAPTVNSGLSVFAPCVRRPPRVLHVCLHCPVACNVSPSSRGSHVLPALAPCVRGALSALLYCHPKVGTWATVYLVTCNVDPSIARVLDNYLPSLAGTLCTTSQVSLCFYLYRLQPPTCCNLRSTRVRQLQNRYRAGKGVRVQHCRDTATRSSL